MEIGGGKPFYIYISKLTVKPAILQNYENRLLFKYARDDYRHMLREESLIPMQYHKIGTSSTVGSIWT